MGKNNRTRRKRKLAQKAARKKRRREKSKTRGRRRTLAPTFHLFRNPFEGLSDEQRRLAIKEIAKNSEKKYQKSLSELRVILRRHFPLVVLSHMSYYDLRLLDVFTFLASDLAESLGLDEVRVSAILDEYALAWGGLSAYETEHLHLSNPVWQKPLVKLGDGKYFCALPASFFSFVIPCMESVLSPFVAAVSERRAEYLECKVAEIVERRFPGSNVKRNFRWVANGATYPRRRESPPLPSPRPGWPGRSLWRGSP